VVAGAGFDRTRRVELPEQLAVGGAKRDDIRLVVAEVEPVADHDRRGFEVRSDVRRPLPDAALGVDRDQATVEVGEEDDPVVDHRRGHVGRDADVARVGGPFPDDPAIAQAHRFRIAELVDHVGDAAGDRGWELDQRVGVDRPGSAQRGVEVPARGGKVVGALGDPSEKRPVDQRRLARAARCRDRVAAGAPAAG
jgi:hypothetical protein